MQNISVRDGIVKSIDAYKGNGNTLDARASCVVIVNRSEAKNILESRSSKSR
jgi:hypothetical protein